MQYTVIIKGIRPLIMHNGAAGLDARSPANLEKAEITRKRGSNRTVSDDERLFELECQTSLWLDAGGAPTIPPAAIRSMIETAARKQKQGPQVREGLIVDEVLSFDYDRERYAPLSKNSARMPSSPCRLLCSATAFSARGPSLTIGPAHSA